MPPGLSAPRLSLRKQLGRRSLLGGPFGSAALLACGPTGVPPMPPPQVNSPMPSPRPGDELDLTPN